EKAFHYCLDMHKDANRKSGLPYYTHPLNVALILLREFSINDTPSLAAALLHDTIEDVKGVVRSTIKDEFSEEIAEIVDAVTKISHQKIIRENTGFESPEAKQKSKASTYRKLFLALVKDVRVILIKFADRLHNMRTLHYMPENKQRSIALETLNFYTPLAHRLGLTKLKMELENRSFYYSDRSAYEAIRQELNEKRRDFIDYIKVFSDHIQNSLNNHNLDHIISIVHKHEYEIYKMIQEGKSISDIDNFYSMVIILDTDDPMECYRAHGVLANAFNTVGFVDYIANPKLDWYKALNSELFGPDGKRVEILIRSREMEKISEEGFASKFSLKTGRIRALEYSDKEIENWGEWMQDMIEERGEQAAQIIWDAIKVNLFDSELITFTMDGKTVKLPDGASLIDFAFALSKNTGMHVITAKVNGVIKELNYKLLTGDQVHIITSPNMKPRPEWKNFVVSHVAVSNLHKYFKENPYIPQLSEKDEGPQIVALKITGEDREGMLKDISEAIGKSNIRRVSLDTSESDFEGTISIKIEKFEEINEIFAKLLNIKGIKGIEHKDDRD
ncbi:MAG: HD domain-containing protein, partial [Bacteroidota bacterium]